MLTGAFCHRRQTSGVGNEEDFSVSGLECVGERFFVFRKWIRFGSHGAQNIFTQEGEYSVVEGLNFAGFVRAPPFIQPEASQLNVVEDELAGWKAHSGKVHGAEGDEGAAGSEGLNEVYGAGTAYRVESEADWVAAGQVIDIFVEFVLFGHDEVGSVLAERRFEFAPPDDVEGLETEMVCELYDADSQG